MCKAAYRHSGTHRLPAHAFGKLRHYSFECNALQSGAACGFIGCVHIGILQDLSPEHLQRGYTLICLN